MFHSHLTATAERDTVLVVDDNPQSLHFLIDTIERAGMTVLIATNGHDALELLEHVAPDLILIDAIMPGLDGFDTTRAIKKQSRLASIPVIFMTGLAESEHAARSLEAGGVDYVRKPIVIEELLARIKVHLLSAQGTGASRPPLDVTGRHLFAVDQAGRLLWATPHVEGLMASMGDSERLPEEFAEPVAQLLADRGRAGASVSFAMAGRLGELVLIGAVPRDEGESFEILIRVNLLGERAERERSPECHGMIAGQVAHVP